MFKIEENNFDEFTMKNMKNENYLKKDFNFLSKYLEINGVNF